ncbi:MAG TPA: HEPN domain-containing protein [Anaerolineales bacterium]|nr:HEPN domain-containing protein [Anaerolineales bacterium]
MTTYADEIKQHLGHTVTSLQAAKSSLEKDQYDLAASYAAESAFHTATALLLDEEIEPGKHDDVITLIRQVFVDKRRLTKEQGEKLSWLFQMRGRENSEAAAPLILGEAQKAVEFAESFFEAAKVILEA